MSKTVRVPVTPKYKAVRNRVMHRTYPNIRKFAEQLIQLPHHDDKDGRVIGDDYGVIRRHILRKYPKVLNDGPHKGQPTQMPIKELQAIACELNRNGVKLPFRPRRRTRTKSKKDKRR